MAPVFSHLIDKHSSIRFQDLEEGYVCVWMGVGLCIEGDPEVVADTLSQIAYIIRDRLASDA